ncbi:MAG: hypothetical protein P1V35_12835 [Planctomycetota bacterium]|nr:hypothetical protein [Planctomycetota bacterium]
MQNRQTPRVLILFGILALFLLGVWQFGFPSRADGEMAPGSNEEETSAPAGKREIIAGETPPTGEAPEQPKGSDDRPLKDETTEKPRERIGKKPDRTPKPLETDTPPKSPYRWIAVDEYGAPVVEALYQLAVKDRRGFAKVWEVESDAKGLLDLPVEALHKNTRFLALGIEGGEYVVEAKGQDAHEPLLKEPLIRVIPKGTLHIRMVDSKGNPSRVEFSVMLSPLNGDGPNWRPDHLSEPSSLGDLEWKCPPGRYRLSLAMDQRIHHMLSNRPIEQMPFQVQVQPGRETRLMLREPTWISAAWMSSSGDEGEIQAFELLGSLRHLFHSPNPEFRWSYAERPTEDQDTPPHPLMPIGSLARILQGDNKGSLAFLSTRGIRVLPDSHGPRHIQLDALTGDQVRTEFRSLTTAEPTWPMVSKYISVSTARFKHTTPDWLEIVANYENDAAWKRAEARVFLKDDSKPLKIGKLIQPAVLDLNHASRGRSKPPISPGLRWTTTKGQTELSRLQVDLLPSSDLSFAIPTLRQEFRSECGTLGWTPTHRLGVMGIGEWRVPSLRRKQPAPPGFRTFQLQCLQPSGKPAPYAMVQAKGRSSLVRWTGVADAKGRIRLEVLGSGPFWIDSDLIPNPVQLQLDERTPTQQELALVVPMERNRLRIEVSGEGHRDHLQANLTLWDPPRDDPKRIYPLIASEPLHADGTLEMPNLVPADYALELVNSRTNQAIMTQRVQITPRNPNPIAQFFLP